MPEFLDSTGKIVFLGRELGRGGEGIVYEVLDKPELVAKIYHEPITDDKAEKLRQMVALQSEKLLRLAAWVTEVLHTAPDGKIVGFLMPRLNSGKAIHELYNPKSRRRHYPEADWRFLVHAAANLARAFAVIHAHGHAIGDVNHGNVVIARDATVRLIDCDSYHLNAPEQSFLCEVGVSTHTPPELQGKSLREVERTANHDAFGLSVMIFQMLFMGRHPFSGTYLGDGDNTLENSIKESRFAYGDDAEKRLMRQPPGTLPLSAVSARVAELFERAFLTIEERPTAREWVEALENLEENLSGCSINSAHYYYKGLSKCAWCALEAQTGVLFFAPRFTGEFSADGELDLVTLGRLIDAIKPPELSPNLPAKTQNHLIPFSAPLPLSQKIEQALESYNWGLIIFLVVLGFTVFWFSVLVGLQYLFIVGWGIYSVCTMVIKKLTKTAQDEAQLAVDDARFKWEEFKEEWNKTVQAKQFEKAREELKTSIQEYRELPKVRDDKLKKLEAKNYENKLEIYLRTFSIRRAEKIDIDGERLETLRSKGIKTAADITKKKFNAIPSFSYVHRRRLFEWRDELEKKFVFKPNDKLSKFDVEDVENEIATFRQKLETKIKEGFPKLQQISVQISKKYHELAAHSETLAARLSQAESDVKRVAKLKDYATAWTVGVVMTALVIGIPINLSNSFESSEPVSYEAPRRRGGSGTGTGFKVATSEPVEVNNDYKNQTTATEEVETPEKWGEAGKLYLSGEGYFAQRRYTEAVEVYRRAVKLDPKIAAIHNKLGESYFQMSRYNEAINSYENALKLKPNADVYHKLGLAFTELKNLDKAITAYKKAIDADPEATMSYYELGSALRKTGKAKDAIEFLEAAITLNSNFTDAHFELGMCYSQIGYSDLALREYRSLKELDSVLANRFLEVISRRDVSVRSATTISPN